MNRQKTEARFGASSFFLRFYRNTRNFRSFHLDNGLFAHV